MEVIKNTEAIILAAGVGSRLFPKTKNTPKCLIPIGGKPILQCQLEILLDLGIRNITIVIGYMGNKLEEFISNNKYSEKANFTFIENKEYATTNSSYSLWLAKDKIRNGYLHLNSDLLFDATLINNLFTSKNDNVVVLDRQRYDLDMARAIIDNSYVISMGKASEFPQFDAVVVGPFLFSSQAAKTIVGKIDDDIKKGKKNSWCYLDFADMVKHNQFKLHYIDAGESYWHEIDTHEDLESAEKTYQIFLNNHNGIVGY